jgi:rubrerythrin
MGGGRILSFLQRGKHGHGFADPKFNWTCDACGHQWQDDGNEEKY